MRKEVGLHDQLRRTITGYVRGEVEEDHAVAVLTKATIKNLRVPEASWEEHAPAVREALQKMKRGREDATVRLRE